MKPSKLYIAGPIANIHNGNREKFQEASLFVKNLGFETVVPFDIPPVEHPGELCPIGPIAGEHTAPCYIKSDLIEMLKCDGVVFIPGWEYASGAMLEFQVAKGCGMFVFKYHNDRRGIYLEGPINLNGTGILV